MPRKAKTIVHVNQHVIRSNKKTGATDPVITVKQGRENVYAHRASLVMPDGTVVAQVRYEPEKPLSCGARVWVEVPGDSPVHVVVEGVDGE